MLLSKFQLNPDLTLPVKSTKISLLGPGLVSSGGKGVFCLLVCFSLEGMTNGLMAFRDVAGDVALVQGV